MTGEPSGTNASFRFRHMPDGPRVHLLWCLAGDHEREKCLLPWGERRFCVTKPEAMSRAASAGAGARRRSRESPSVRMPRPPRRSVTQRPCPHRRVLIWTMRGALGPSASCSIRTRRTRLTFGGRFRLQGNERKAQHFDRCCGFAASLTRTVWVGRRAPRQSRADLDCDESLTAD